MRDRADGVGGSLSVQSEPGRGTVVEMEVPGG
jgi:signal transduction histidine kinase